MNKASTILYTEKEKTTIILTNIVKMLVNRKWIDRAYKMLIDLDSGLKLYAYVYIMIAIDIFLQYLFTNSCYHTYYELYFLNCLKIVISLYDDIIDTSFSFEYIGKFIDYKNYSMMIKIQKSILMFNDYDFNMKNIIRNYMEELDDNICDKIGTYIRKNIYKSDFLLLDFEKKIEKIKKHINKKID